MTIAITAATGQLGRLAIAALQARGHSPIALARNPAKAADIGVPVRAFDYFTADATALVGVDVLVLISSNDFNDRMGQHARVIAAAKAAGVGRIVYTSILKGAASPLILVRDHITTEADLHASGLTVTILRNGWYTENYTGSLGGAIAAGAMVGTAGDARLSTAARADYAEAIAVVATADGHAGQTYELAGDTAHTLGDMAAEVSRQTGKPLPYADMPADAYKALLVSFGLPEVLVTALVDADTHAKAGYLFDDSKTLSRLIGRPTTPMAATVTAALSAL